MSSSKNLQLRKSVRTFAIVGLLAAALVVPTASSAAVRTFTYSYVTSNSVVINLFGGTAYTSYARVFFDFLGCGPLTLAVKKRNFSGTSILVDSTSGNFACTQQGNPALDVAVTASQINNSPSQYDYIWAEISGTNSPATVVGVAVVNN
jgi:hypothetical protein